jgi:hypothetical protein
VDESETEHYALKILSVGTTVSMRMNWYVSHIRSISHDSNEVLQSVLRTIGKAALIAERRIEDASKSHNIEDVAEVAAEENIFIEDLLGCALVVSQGYITRITSRLRYLHKCLKRDGHCLSIIPGTKNIPNKPDLMKACSSLVAGMDYTQIQVIDAFANYFKHHEEWPAKWDEASNQAQ